MDVKLVNEVNREGHGVMLRYVEIVCIYVYIYMYVCMYVYIHVCMYVCMYI